MNNNNKHIIVLQNQVFIPEGMRAKNVLNALGSHLLSGCFSASEDNCLIPPSSSQLVQKWVFISLLRVILAQCYLHCSVERPGRFH